MPVILAGMLCVFDYARRLARLPAARLVPMASAAATSPPARQFDRDAIPLNFDGEHEGPDRGFVGPLIRI
jgi:hypothetical protein